MATANTALPKFNFPGPVGTKRRRMRSGGNVSTLSNNAASVPSSNLGPPNGLTEEPQIVTLAEADDVGEKVVQTSKCKGATTIPIFLKKTYKMIDTCDPTIASWTEEGDMFVVKDPDVFATQVIPQYFDHNKFSSFARQLNFYGFRKMQSKPIRNSDFDAGTAKHVTFFNENFKRGRCDLLKKIQRSTRGSGGGTGQDQAREIQNLRDQVVTLENKIQDMQNSSEERFRRLELDMLARIEQVMMAMQQQQQAQLRLQSATSVGQNSVNSGNNSGMASNNGGGLRQQSQGWESLQAPLPRNTSMATNNTQQNSNSFPQMPQRQSMQQVNSTGSNPPSSVGGPTLPPHPKQKQFPMPGSMNPPNAPDRLNSLRGISALSRGISGLPRGTSVESSASAVLMRNSWEDKFFSMLMLDEQQNAAAAAAQAQQQQQQQQQGNPQGNQADVNNNLMMNAMMGNNGQMNGMMGGMMTTNMNNGATAPSMVSEQSNKQSQPNGGNNPADDLSSVSSSDIP
mmetsp:Transcript_13037/g.28561  ORF Transcript_13037/g.28561 Transcript_13037/m.28561 type:complete len:511 (+) Transcript_13037:144-1676(+)|eukprot:CAMPEP_0168735006 /NCGR_PEP_ID=MMETSP0724-20121128/9109_1 /TAXON_ID=265536 /ORGANISM="Amphiprora sp., Strain CCMP467" /LENGTH=510 /DNA_ID=CAMNT_0008782133 /DNA_START=67 /DNA_END=1599 /DNA_ORIENTATION=+